jgi:dTDP-4-amino-4,6-dideoxygalactose transaminase
MYDAERVLLCDSGTTALRLAIVAASSAVDRRAIAVPAFGCFDLVTAAVGADADVRFYDVDPSTLGPDFDSLERVLASGAGTIVAAHLYGLPIDWARLEPLSERFGAIVVEDAAMGHGAGWNGRPLGSLAPLGVLSFGRGKGWTGGGGGALLARGDLASRLEALPALAEAEGPVGTSRTLLAAAGQALFSSPSLYGLPASVPGLRLGDTVYHPPSRPRRMSAVSARLVLETREPSEAEVETRRHTVEEYRREVPPGLELRHARPAADGTCGALRHPVLIAGGLQGLGAGPGVRSLGIERSYPQVLPDLDAASAWGRGSGELWPGARRLVRELVTLPTHSRVGDHDFARIVRRLRGVRGRAASELGQAGSD